MLNSNQTVFKNMIVVIIVFVFIVLTITLLVGNNLFKPTVPTIQVYSLTKSSNVLITHDSFLNFIVNFRLVETILFTTLVTIIFLNNLDERKYIIVTITTIFFPILLLFNQLLIKNPYPTIPVFRIYLGLHILILDCIGFLLLLVYSVIYTTLLILVLKTTCRFKLMNSVSRNSFIILTLVLSLTIITRDYVIGYILIYVSLLTILTTVAVKSID